ncbi:hypothetical protein [Candidatus Villigracilis saccharophilus]|uniref:hypothetical protein n=1 Tax=Candidatus Villigracilis saccharophilus TaxID=3140684 RepID=UPI003136335B|nr:hypothetical protein [Anaerolineales bacterium]
MTTHNQLDLTSSKGRLQDEAMDFAARRACPCRIKSAPIPGEDARPARADRAISTPNRYCRHVRQGSVILASRALM